MIADSHALLQACSASHDPVPCVVGATCQGAAGVACIRHGWAIRPWRRRHPPGTAQRPSPALSCARCGARKRQPSAERPHLAIQDHNAVSGTHRCACGMPWCSLWWCPWRCNGARWAFGCLVAMPSRCASLALRIKLLLRTSIWCTPEYMYTSQLEQRDN